MPGLRDMDDMSSGGVRSDSGHQCLLGAHHLLDLIFKLSDLARCWYAALKHWSRVFRLIFELFHMFMFILEVFRTSGRCITCMLIAIDAQKIFKKKSIFFGLIFRFVLFLPTGWFGNPKPDVELIQTNLRPKIHQRCIFDT